MRCPDPKCDGETHRVVRTQRGHTSDVRKCICRACHRVFDTVAKVVRVHTEGGEAVPVEQFRRRRERGEEDAA